MNEVGNETAWLAEAFQRLSQIGVALVPTMQRFAAALDGVCRAWLREYPGMPYTGPSLWEPEQMLTYPRRQAD